MVFDVVTIFPDFFKGPFDFGVVRRGREKGLIETRVHDLRDFASDHHHTVDDRPFGGGEGMVFKPEPIFKAVESVRKADAAEVVVLSAGGRKFNQAEALRLSKASQIVLICGRYEGVDERVAEALVTDEVSIGDYVLSCGEPAALVVVDALVRLIPGALGSETSATTESFSDGLLDYPHYTRPPEFEGMSVPEVLLTGHHAEIAKWRREAAEEKTKRNRPDLLKE